MCRSHTVNDARSTVDQAHSQCILRLVRASPHFQIPIYSDSSPVLMFRSRALPSGHTRYPINANSSHSFHSTTTCQTAGPRVFLRAAEDISPPTGQNVAFRRPVLCKGMSSITLPGSENVEDPFWPEEDHSLTTDQRGGFYAVRLGEMFEERYVVTRKLGFGGFSSVWLARDLRCVQMSS